MLNIESIYGPEFGYLKADDLAGPTKYVIESYYIYPFNGGEKRKIVLVLKGQKKRLVLNKTNAFKLASKYGYDVNAWVGKEIVIEPATTTFMGRKVKGLSVV